MEQYIVTGKDEAQKLLELFRGCIRWSPTPISPWAKTEAAYQAAKRYAQEQDRKKSLCITVDEFITKIRTEQVFYNGKHIVYRAEKKNG